MTADNTIQLWEKYEVSLFAKGQYDNPYMDVDVWVDLSGPGFQKRIYGFWDGGQNFKVRLTATCAGEWSWQSGSNQDDDGLNGVKGNFTAAEWSDDELAANSCRRGFIQASANGHAFNYADGTPYYLLADTWWATPTFRFPWYDDDQERPVGPEMGFKDMVRLRKEQGYNSIAMLAALPNWSNDGEPAFIEIEHEGKKISLRAAWGQAGTNSAKDMHNEGGKPFAFPGRVPGYEEIFPDLERINPEYFQYMDRKVDYLNSEGFIPFIEVARRDISPAWKEFYSWPESYARYVQYVFARYQANNCLLSPIHFDWHLPSIPSREYNEPINLYISKYGPPPFGTLLGCNSSPSSLVNFGDDADGAWVTFHQTGNWREHDYYWYLTEIFRSEPAKPALNGEPYYPGFPDDNPKATSIDAELNCRSGMYGSLLSGGLAGYIYGAQGLWSADVEEQAPYKIWDALQFRSGAQVPYLQNFLEPFMDVYQELVPDADLITPNKMGDPMGYRGWAYCAKTPDKNVFLAYFEKDFPEKFNNDRYMTKSYKGETTRAIVRGAEIDGEYLATWFDPRSGQWLSDKAKILKADMIGRIFIEEIPDNQDWALSLVRKG